MKHKLLIVLLALEAAACVALSIAKVSLSGAFSAVAAFPFEQIGIGLRALALSGSVGNAAALTLYAAICLFPVWFLLRASGRRSLMPEDVLLGILSALLFTVLYLMINTGKLDGLFGGVGAAGLSVAKAVMGSAVYSMVFGYLLLRVLRLFLENSTERLVQYMGVLLGLLSGVFVWAVFFGGFGEMLSDIAALQSGNTGAQDTLGLSYVFLVLKFIVDALPWALNIVTVFLGLELLNAVRLDFYSEQTVLIAEKLSKWCVRVLATVVLSNIGFNALQLIFAGALRSIESSLLIPVVSVAFVLAVLLLTRIIAENRRLKSDNDLFI